MTVHAPRRVSQPRLNARHGSASRSFGQHAQDNQAQTACFCCFGGHVLIGCASHAGNNARRVAAVTANSRVRVAEVAR